MKKILGRLKDFFSPNREQSETPHKKINRRARRSYLKKDRFKSNKKGPSFVINGTDRFRKDVQEIHTKVGVKRILHYIKVR